jgi:hypothetical protein
LAGLRLDVEASISEEPGAKPHAGICAGAIG